MERDLKRRNKENTRYVDGLGHKGLADLIESTSKQLSPTGLVGFCLRLLRPRSKENCLHAHVRVYVHIRIHVHV